MGPGAVVPIGLVAVGSPARILSPDRHDGIRAILERIGTQFVRSDDLSGAGVSAPSYVPEQD